MQPLLPVFMYVVYVDKYNLLRDHAKDQIMNLYFVLQQT